MIKYLLIVFIIISSCGTKSTSLEGTWTRAYSEIISEGKITRVGGFEIYSEKKLIFLKDSMQIVNGNNNITATSQYETRGDTLILEHGIQMFIFKISSDTLRLIPLLPEGTVTSVLLRE